MPLVERPTCAVHYEDLGPKDAPAVVLMPSLLCDRRMWGPLAPSLARTWRVLDVDLRGHGRSSAPTKNYTLEEQADDIAAVLDHAGVDKAALVGLSQGGMTGLRLALQHPTRVRALVLVDSSADPEGAFVRWKYMALAATVRAVGVLGILEAQITPLMFGDAFLKARPETVAEWVARWRALDRLGVYRAVRAVAMRSDVAGRLGDIHVPTRVVHGTGDRAIAKEHGERLASRIAGAELHLLDGVGHLSAVEKPDEMVRVVSDFLDRHGRI